MATACIIVSFALSGFRVTLENVTDTPVHFEEVITLADRLPQLLRSDAQDNRDRVLDAARALFSEHGLDVPMRVIARRAGVGPATLYRRFPTKQDLVNDAFTDELADCRLIVQQGCAEPDPWRGFSSVIERLSVLNARNQGFVNAFMSANPDAKKFIEHRDELHRQLAHLSQRAKRSGALRQDFVMDDLVLVLLAARGLSSVLPGAREARARRFAVLAVDAFRNQASTEARIAPVTRRPEAT
jgi:AcrR family transcriptional regulator